MLKIDSASQYDWFQFSRIVVIWTCVAAFFHFILSLSGFGWPWNSFLFDPADRFNDFLNSVQAAGTGRPYSGSTTSISPYFPFTYLLLYPISLAPVELRIFLYFCVIFILFTWLIRDLNLNQPVSCVYLKSRFKYIGYFGLILFINYPSLYAIDRGSLDIIIALLVAIYVVNFKEGKASRLVPLCIAISMKGYPAAFILMELSDKKYWTVATLAVASLALSLAGLLFFYPDIGVGITELLESQRQFTRYYVLDSWSLFATTDYLSALKLVYAFFSGDNRDIFLFTSGVIDFYLVFSLSLSLIISLVIIKGELTSEIRILGCALICLLFPHISNDYKITVMLSFVAIWALNPKVGYPYPFVLLFAAYFIPKSYFFVRGIPISGIINPLILTGLIWWFLKVSYISSHWVERSE